MAGGSTIPCAGPRSSSNESGSRRREIVAHLAETYGMQTSKETVSTITDKALDSMADWRTRPLDPVYPVLFVDCVNVKIRDGAVANRPVYVVLAVTCDGHREILGLWTGNGGEGAKYWQNILAELQNRGVRDVLMLVCDGLKGLPEAVGAVFPQTVVQLCIVHLIRTTLKYISRQDWDAAARDLRPVYTAAKRMKHSPGSPSSVRDGKQSTRQPSGPGNGHGARSCPS